MKSHLVSVVIPYYRSKKFFIQSIRSVENQSYKNIEIIITYDDEDKSELKFIKNVIKNNYKIPSLDSYKLNSARIKKEGKHALQNCINAINQLIY